MDDGGDEVRAAGIGAGFHQDGVDITHDDAGHQGQNAVGRLVHGV